MKPEVTVLIADDHPLLRRGLRDVLAGNSRFKIVGEAPDGHEALRLLTSLRPQITIVDIDMPGMDGIETARRLTSLYPCSIIFSTGLWDDKTLQRSREVHAASYLVKPFSPAQLQAALQLSD